ncbi:glutathione peroxidase 3 [Grus japonensis]|uniref:Glutathione peroxidase n=1 Tax=Grus japonensis TaxID=30415 RepID=A0ABC9XE54_GRUJA
MGDLESWGETGRSQEFEVKCYSSVQGTIYDYGALTIDGDEYIPFRKYVGKMVLFVNVATSPWSVLPWGARELNALQNELGPYGLVVLGFPSNQFGKQEPGQNSEILPALKYVRPGGGFVPNFQLFQKGDVNGAKEQKVYTFLKNACPPVAEEFGNPKNLFWEPLRNHDIKWNFEKFLVGPDGVPVMRWYHRANIAVVKNDIIAYMRQQQGQ